MDRLKAIRHTGRKLKILSRKWMLRLAVDDMRGRAIPLFQSRRLNRAIVALAGKLQKKKTHVHPAQRKHPDDE